MKKVHCVLMEATTKSKRITIVVNMRESRGVGYHFAV